MAGGIDLFAQQNLSTSYVSYDTKTLGVNLRLGFALTEELSLQPHYSIYRQEITLPRPVQLLSAQHNENTCTPASLPVRLELAQGPVIVSLVGYTVSYNTLDNVNQSDQRPIREHDARFGRRRRRRELHPHHGEVRNYYEVLPDVVGVVKLQGGHETGWGGKDLRMLDHFFMGPNLVRGFAPAGIGPRDLSVRDDQ